VPDVATGATLEKGQKARIATDALPLLEAEAKKNGNFPV